MERTDLLTAFNLFQTSVSSKWAWRWECICLQGGTVKSQLFLIFRNPRAFSASHHSEGNSIMCVCRFNMVILDRIAHRLSLLKAAWLPMPAFIQRRERERERFRSHFPNQYTGYERWQIWPSPSPCHLLSYHLSSPKHADLQMTLSSSGASIPRQVKWL